MAYEYRTIGRGGQGIVNIETSARNGPVVASFPVDDDDQIVMMSDKGRLIRMPVHDIRIASRNTQGVTLFNTEKNEKVVSVAHITGPSSEDEEENENVAFNEQVDE